jgi:hypothetical protein
MRWLKWARVGQAAAAEGRADARLCRALKRQRTRIHPSAFRTRLQGSAATAGKVRALPAAPGSHACHGRAFGVRARGFDNRRIAPAGSFWARYCWHRTGHAPAAMVDVEPRGSLRRGPVPLEGYNGMGRGAEADLALRPVPSVLATVRLLCTVAVGVCGTAPHRQQSARAGARRARRRPLRRVR